MKKTIDSSISFVLFIFVMIFLCSCASAKEGSLSRDKPTQDAVELTKKMIFSDENEKNKILYSFKELMDKNPENIAIRNMYINNLIAEKHYKEGLSYLRVMNKENLTRTNLLTQCMLQERLGNRDEECYKKVISLSQENNAIDSDYLSALFFMDDKRFYALKNELIKENKFKKSDFLVFTLGKEKMLHEFFP
ncbi:hypothetical protein ACFL9S_00245 [Erwinia sp. AnSW2-5]|uniref:hypothetical protein n=1 Tax=Erwinia sp. AnSW2-5 TaxID=3367692 RepID=UPI00385C1915